ncbi:RNA polymerase sigma factor RpoH [Rickettsiella endosymbiont of Litargus connexus]|jgi:RNA polymerase sigma-32 factor|uniref:RNA polymerase sigma factor RpoH n=1 Tax=Rickettsiella endosymbiont of Litargus connexus TaxID=3066237 RepID=UPI0027FC1C5E|nr:RNA polymerase sigma factor RpoH [Gammaproteobacteria bacterium]MCH9754520.1 RNA polymerase sigma factor RpoH [Gammaproteobacteria bacterium]MDD4893092.1 RNA polymerase sigma factor RpoH [Candidatus Rickettsiella isopodorum]MDD5162339.1 RNA polymerase sigma factor RpoH [Candidatus Rickettsiella isopodorum]MDQ5900228.1 polymerase sigma-32 factor [Pseudomonadota bacterium]
MNTHLQTLYQTLPINSTDAYIARLKQIPVLSAEEETELAERYYQHQDLIAAKKLIIANLRFVVHIAQTYMGYGLALADLIQEGNIGLMKAVKRFDPKVGVRLISFAVHWIKAEIQEFILRNWRIVKIATTKAQRKLFFNLRKMKKHLGWFNQKEIEAVARDLGVKPETVREMESRLASNDMSLDISEDDKDTKSTHYPRLDMHFEDNRYDPARLLEASDSTESSQDHLYKALAKLDEREQNIIRDRWLIEPKITLQELANRYQVSAERVRQLEQKAIKALRHAIEEQAA